MTQINVAVMEFQEGGRAIWIHNDKGCTVLRIQCTGKVRIHQGCTNICAHADINVTGNIEVCIPSVKPERKMRAAVGSGRRNNPDKYQKHDHRH